MKLMNAPALPVLMGPPAVVLVPAFSVPVPVDGLDQLAPVARMNASRSRANMAPASMSSMGECAVATQECLYCAVCRVRVPSACVRV